jgi:hypothetical protein
LQITLEDSSDGRSQVQGKLGRYAVRQAGYNGWPMDERIRLTAMVKAAG